MMASELCALHDKAYLLALCCQLLGLFHGSCTSQSGQDKQRQKPAASFSYPLLTEVTPTEDHGRKPLRCQLVGKSVTHFSILHPYTGVEPSSMARALHLS